MSWWVLTDPQKTGTCERCKRPASEHTWECGICRMVGRRNSQYLAKAVLGRGDSGSFRMHTYTDHPPGAYGGVTLCYCPTSAIPAPPTVVVQPTVIKAPEGSAPVSPTASTLPPQAPPQAPPARPSPQAPPGERCACTSCKGCTQGTACFRPPDGGGGKCMVCAFFGGSIASVPAPQAPSPSPVRHASPPPPPPSDPELAPVVLDAVEEPPVVEVPSVATADVHTIAVEARVVVPGLIEES